MEWERGRQVWPEQRARGLQPGRPVSARRRAAERATWFPQAYLRRHKPPALQQVWENVNF